MEGYSEGYEEEETLASLLLSIALNSSGTLRVFDGGESPSLGRARHQAAEHLANGGKELGHALADAAHSAEHALHHTKHHHSRDVKVDVDMPKVDVDLPKVDVPNVDVPKVDIPKPKLGRKMFKKGLQRNIKVDVPNVDVPKVDVPKADVPEVKGHHLKADVDLPKVDIDVPKVDVPKVDVHLHAHDLPKVDIDVPKVDVPKVDVPEVKVHDMKAEVDVPKVDVPKVDVPEVKVHDMKAEVDVPKVDVPKVDVPKPKVKLPKAKISKIFKGIKHKLPMASRAIGINIDVPQHLPGLFAVTGELIRPGPPEITGLPLRNEYDETQTNFWDEYRKPYAGQIVFSSKPIDRFFQREELKNRFEAGSDIHARAVFPRALRNYPIAHKKGKPDVPVYGPKFILAGSCRELNLHALQVFVFVSVDGKPVGRELKWKEEVICGPLMMSTEVGPTPPGSFSRNDDACRNYAENFSPETVDFWAMNQSMVFGLVRKDYNMADTWDQGIPLLMKTLAQLPPGEHKVEVDFRFRLFANEETCVTWRTQGLLPASECFPEKGTTPISHPIARGEFIYAITAESAASALAASNPLPKRSTKLPDDEADRLEKLILEVMKESPDWGNRRVKTERILKVVITGEGWHRLAKTHFCTPLCLNPCPVWANEPRKYALDFVAVVYRSPLDGWPEEMPCVAFDLGAAAYDTTPKNKRDIVRIGVGNNWEIDVDLIPESAFEEAGLKRCPVAVRRGFAK